MKSNTTARNRWSVLIVFAADWAVHFLLLWILFPRIVFARSASVWFFLCSDFVNAFQTLCSFFSKMKTMFASNQSRGQNDIDAITVGSMWFNSLHVQNIRSVHFTCVQCAMTLQVTECSRQILVNNLSDRQMDSVFNANKVVNLLDLFQFKVDTNFSSISHLSPLFISKFSQFWNNFLPHILIGVENSERK